MKPGDIIEWVYVQHDNVSLSKTDCVLSSVTHQYVRQSSFMIVIAIDDDVCTYYDENGLHTVNRVERTEETIRWDSAEVRLEVVDRSLDLNERITQKIDYETLIEWT